MVITDSLLFSNLVFELFQVHILMSEANEVEFLLTFKLKIDRFLHFILYIITLIAEIL